METGCQQRSAMAAVLTVSILCGSLRMGCPQLTPLLQTAASHAPKEPVPVHVSALAGDNSARRVQRSAEVSREHVITATSTAMAEQESTEKPEVDRRSDRDGQHGDGDGHSSDREGQGRDTQRHRWTKRGRKDREGQKGNIYGRNIDRDGQSMDIIEQRIDRYGQRRHRDKQISDRDRQRRNTDEESISRDRQIKDTDGHKREYDGERDDSGRQRRDTDTSNYEINGHRHDKDEQSKDRYSQSGDSEDQRRNRKGQHGSRDGQRRETVQSIDISGQSRDSEDHSRNRKGQNSSRDGQRGDIVQSIDISGQSRDSEDQSSNRDGQSREINGQTISRVGNGSGRGGSNKDNDGQYSRRDGHSRDKDGQSRDRYEQIIHWDGQNSNRDGQSRHINIHTGDNDTQTYVLKLDAGHLMDCNNNPSAVMVMDGLDMSVTSSLSKRTLIMDFHTDNQTLTPKLTTHMYGCSISSYYFITKRYVWLKVLLFEIASVENFVIRLTLTPYDGLVLKDNLERSQMFLSEYGINIGFGWHQIVPKEFRLEMQYKVVDDQGDLDLNLTFTSSTKGTLRTPFWDGVSAYASAYAINQDAKWQRRVIKVSPYGGIIVSWEHIGVSLTTSLCPDGRIILGTIHGLILCGQIPPAPYLFKGSSFDVRYQPFKDKSFQSKIRNTGFSLRFSLHNDSAIPQQLPNGSWNCSVPYWEDFREHFVCNLLTECVGGEDEAACPYSDGTCPHGYMSAGGSCFTFELERYMTWNEADAACKVRGDRLPTLNTEDKWRAVVDLLTYRGWHYVYVGLTSGHSSLPNQYSGFHQWSDLSVAYYVKAETTNCKPCAFFLVDRVPGVVYLDDCEKTVQGNLLCERPPSRSNDSVRVADGKAYSQITSTRCPKGHVTHNFLSCDPLSHCFSGCYDSPSLPLTSPPPVFLCKNQFQRVPFTLVCDHRADCSDASDEICEFPPCQGFECKNKQCIPRNKTCDGVRDCVDNSDEFTCTNTVGGSGFINMTKALPAMVLHDGKGFYGLFDIVGHTGQSQPAEARLDCPDSHFQCPGISYYCLPVYVRCNGVFDCPGRQDEADCDSFLCPGFYRCRDSKVCLHGDFLCDRVFQCPQRDDELMCGFVCPVGCTCYGLAFYCTAPFEASSHKGLRFLDARGSGMSLTALVNNTMLFYLNIAKCNITHLDTIDFVNIRHLDLSDNWITSFAESHVSSCKSLQTLIISGNPIRSMLENSSPSSATSLPLLDVLDLSSVPMNSTTFENFQIFRNVYKLNLSYSGIDTVSAFSVFSRLQVLDLRGCPVTYFTRSIFQGLEDLRYVYADNYKMCCPDTLPDGFNGLNCHAPFDEVSSCEGLLKSGLYRFSLSFLTSMITLGNAGSFVYRVFFRRSKKQTSFGLFVTNLCVSDFLMGVYSAIVGVADRLYLGSYVWNDVTWRRSVTCRIAGVLSFVSNEVSVLIICLITVDRFLVIRFPFSRQLHFSPRSARAACVTAWSVGVLLAVTPFFPSTSHWTLYGQTGMCIPLPVTRKRFDGWDYSVGVLVFLNFVLFLVIAIGQISIYLSVSANSMATSDKTQKTKDLTIARRLITVAISDFLCWFPVGLLGILGSRGYPIPGEASVVIAVFVLPLNSALNPFLYTVNVILEQKQKTREQRLLKMLLARHGGSTAQR